MLVCYARLSDSRRVHITVMEVFLNLHIPSLNIACCLVLTKNYHLIVCWLWGPLWQDEAVQQVVDVLEEYSLDQLDMDTIVGMSTLKVWFLLDEVCKFSLIFRAVGCKTRGYSMKTSAGYITI